MVERLRSQYYVNASIALKKTIDMGRESLDLKFIVEEFGKWWERYHAGRFVRLVRGNEYVFIRMINRFMKKYKDRFKHKYSALSFIDWNLRLDLTYDPKRFMTLKAGFVGMNKAWSKLRAWLYKRFGHFEYLRVMEIHDSGRPHFHVLLHGINFIDFESLRTIWEKYVGGFKVWIKRVDRAVYGLNYCLKYVNKSIVGKLNDMLKSAVLFASNCRMFTMSVNVAFLCKSFIFRHNELREISVRIARKGVAQKESMPFEFDGSIGESVLRSYCEEKGILFGDDVNFVRVDDAYDDLYDFPLLFNVNV